VLEEVERGLAWIGTLERFAAPSRVMTVASAGFECASLQVNFGMIGRAEAEASMLLFAREVMPHFT
jgi:hypothetical protein